MATNSQSITRFPYHGYSERMGSNC